MTWHKVFPALALSCSLILSLALATPPPALSADAIRNTDLAFYHDKGQSSGSPFGDIMKSIQKKKDQTQEKPQTPQPAPQAPQSVPKGSPAQQTPPVSPQVPIGTPAQQIPQLPTQAPQAIPTQPATQGPEIPRKVHKNLPPILKRLQDLSGEIGRIHSNPNMYLNSSGARKICNQIDTRSNEAVQLLVDVYTGKTKINVPDDFNILLIFCKLANAEYQTYGWHRGKSAEITHHVVGNIKLLWQAHFLIDLKNRNGHLLRFSLFPITIRKMSENNFDVVKYKGKVLRNLPPTTMVPIDGYNANITGMGATLHLSSEEDFKWKEWGDDPSKWPENIPTKYRLLFTMPVIGYFSSLKRQTWSNNLCDQCLQPLSLAVSPERVSQAIKNGVLTIHQQDNCPSVCVESEFLLKVDLPPLGCRIDKNYGTGLSLPARKRYSSTINLLPGLGTRYFV